MATYAMVSTENLGVITTRPKISEGTNVHAALDEILANEYPEDGALLRIVNLGLERYYRVRPEMKEVAAAARKQAEVRKAQVSYDGIASKMTAKGMATAEIAEILGKRPA